MEKQKANKITFVDGIKNQFDKFDKIYRNPIDEKHCSSKNIITQVSTNKKITVAAIILMITVIPTLLIILYYSSSTTIIFKNNSSLLDSLNYNKPIDNFPLGRDDAHNIVYLNSSSFALFSVSSVNFLVLEKDLFYAVTENKTSLFAFVMYLMTIGNFQLLDPPADIPTSFIAQFSWYGIFNTSTIEVINGGFIGSKDTVFKISSKERYVIPLIGVSFTMLSPEREYQQQAICEEVIYNKEKFMIGRGSYNYELSSLNYNYADAIKWNVDGINFGDLPESTPISANISIMYSLYQNMFEPINDIMEGSSNAWIYIFVTLTVVAFVTIFGIQKIGKSKQN